jgi:guanine deaminase
MQTNLSSNYHGIRGPLLDCIANPFNEEDAIRYQPDGLLVIQDGFIKAYGDYSEICGDYSGLAIAHYPDRLIIPGFIDCHVHYPQTEIIAAHGAQLMDWLDRYTFPAERHFSDSDHARKIASFFLDELLRNGTTTALVLTTIFANSVEILFEEADRRNMRMIAGQVLMSRNAPEFLLKDPEVAAIEVQDQIDRWHGNRRQHYAITPRFAITSTPVELQISGELWAANPGVYMHTHLAENDREIEFTAQLFPNHSDYLAVYEDYGLVGDRAIFAHCIHLDRSGFERLGQSGATIAYCPTSNLFLGSGLFPLHEVQGKVGLATDVGGGSSFSMLKTMAEAYKIGQLQQSRSGQSLSAFQAFYLATLGAAEALSLEPYVGNFKVGKEADLVVLDRSSTPILALRNERSIQSLDDLAEQLFALIILGDDRAIELTYVAGSIAHRRTGL